MAQHPDNLPVLMAFDIIKSEHGPITLRQLREGSIERNAVHYSHGSMILGSSDHLNRSLPTFACLLQT